MLSVLACAPLLLGATGCGHGGEVADHARPVQLETRPGGDFVLYVSDQSFALSPVDITVRVDGKVAVSDEFAVGNEHNWRRYRFQIGAGVHRLTAVSDSGRARFVGSVRMRRTLYGVVDYWYSPGNPGGERKLTFHHSVAPIAFA